MSMKMMTAKDAKNSFGTFLDAVQREPVVVTKRNRPVGVMISLNDITGIIEFADTMKHKINIGIRAGLEDSKAGRGHELTDSYIESLQQEFQERINRNKVE